MLRIAFLPGETIKEELNCIKNHFSKSLDNLIKIYKLETISTISPFVALPVSSPPTPPISSSIDTKIPSKLPSKTPSKSPSKTTKKDFNKIHFIPKNNKRIESTLVRVTKAINNIKSILIQLNQQSVTPHQQKFYKRRSHLLNKLCATFDEFMSLLSPCKTELRDYLVSKSSREDSVKENLRLKGDEIISVTQKLLKIDSELSGHQWQLSDVSPALSTLRDFSISLFDDLGRVDSVKIEFIQPEINVIRTKTRPKRIAFAGSDGGDVTFLLKAKEDLSLDGSVMQVLFCFTAVIFAFFLLTFFTFFTFFMFLV